MGPIARYQSILVDRAGAVGTITFNRPAARNALDLAMREELLTALDDLEADETVRAVILTGAGGHFSAGGDVKSMVAWQTAAEGRARVQMLNRFIMRLFHFSKPTIAMVDGFAVGAGCNIALACDLVIASDRARFGEVFAKIGLVPDGGGTWLLPRLVGLARAKELVFSADIIDAAEALRIGLVNRVVPAADLPTAAQELAARIAAGPSATLALAKSLLNRSATVDLVGALDLEAFAQGQAITSEDHAAGFRPFSRNGRPSSRECR